MNAVSYPEPIAPQPATPSVARLPAPPRFPIRIVAAYGVVALLVAAIAAYLLWPRPSSPRAELFVTGAAEQVVTALLHGDRSTLERITAVEIPETLMSGGSYVRSTAAVSVLDTDGGWEVVVAADHLVAVPGGFGDPRTEHFLVVFQDRPTGPVVVSLPALVPTPESPPVRAAAWPEPPADEATDAIGGYLAWLLAGEAGAFEGAPVTPAPFVDTLIVGMQRVERDGGLEVLVAVEGVRADGTVLPLHYALRLEPGETGWDVSRPGN